MRTDEYGVPILKNNVDEYGVPIITPFNKPPIVTLPSLEDQEELKRKEEIKKNTDFFNEQNKIQFRSSK